MRYDYSFVSAPAHVRVEKMDDNAVELVKALVGLGHQVAITAGEGGYDLTFGTKSEVPSTPFLMWVKGTPIEEDEVGPNTDELV